MTDELGREELLEELEEVWENNYVKDSKLWKRNEQAYRQLKALIQEPGEKKGLIGMAGEIFNEAHENQLEVTEEWIEEKAQQLFQESKEGSFSIKSFCNFFIRKIIEEMPAKKATVSEGIIKKYAVHMSVNAFYDADDHKKGTTPIFEYPRVENALIKFAQEAGLEVKKRA